MASETMLQTTANVSFQTSLIFTVAVISHEWWIVEIVCNFRVLQRMV